MSDAPENDQLVWELTYTSRRLRQLVIALMAVTILIHTVWGTVLITWEESAATIGIEDQVAMVVLGFVWAFIFGTLLRIRVRVGPAGIEVRGPLRTRIWEWEYIVGFTFPTSSRWPRIELPGYEQVSIWAIQSADGETSVEVMRTLLDLARKYKPSAAEQASVADRLP